MNELEALSRAYINEYRNSGTFNNAPATYDYKKYMATSLIKRGFLFQNSKNIEELYRASINELFSTQFKNLFLYAADRDISDIYSDISNIKNMGPIGTQDYLSSVLGFIPAKYLPVFEPFTYDFTSDDGIKINITEEEKRAILLLRGDNTEGLKFVYTKLTPFDKVVGPDLTKKYFVNPKLPDSIGYIKVDTTQLPDPDTDYYEKIDGQFVKTSNFDVVDEYHVVSDDDRPNGVVDGKEYYEKVKNPNTIRYDLASEEEPNNSTQYYIKDPTDPTSFIPTTAFSDKHDYVEYDKTGIIYPDHDKEFFVLKNGVYVKANNSDFVPEYSYEKVQPGTNYDGDADKYYVFSDQQYRKIDLDVDMISIPVQQVDHVEEYVEVIDKSSGPQPNKEYYTKDSQNAYVRVTQDQMPGENLYGQTSDPAYDESKTYYVSDGADGYTEAQDDNFTLTPETTAQMVDVYNETEDVSYDGSKTYYVSIGDGNHVEAQSSDFDSTPETTTQMVDVYNETEDPAYDESKTYYVSDGDDGYTEAQDSNFTLTPETTAQMVDVYNETEDSAYVDSKTYYVSDGADGYTEVQDSNFTLTPETTAQMVDVYNETEDVSYDGSKTYYVDDGSGGYTAAQDDNFTLTPETTAQMVDVYNETEDSAYVDSKTYYVSDGADGYTEAQESDFTVDPDTTDVSFTVGTTYYEKTQEEQQVPTGTNLRSFKGDVTYYEKSQEEQQVPTGTNLRSFTVGTTYYEKTQEEQQVPTGTNLRSFKGDVTYYEKTQEEQQVPTGVTIVSFKDDVTYYEKSQEEQQVPTGTNLRSFKGDVTYYEITGTTKVFDPNVTYYIKTMTEVTSIVGHTYEFDPSIIYFTRNPGYLNTFDPNVTYYTYEVVGKLFMPHVDYYIKTVIDNGYRYDVTTNFNTVPQYNIVDTVAIAQPDPNAEYYTLSDGTYTGITNLQTWNLDTVYYTKTDKSVFKDDVVYYTKETVTKFKRFNENDPRYEYYISTVIDNGYDLDTYEPVTVTDTFEDRDYYVGTVDYENTELTNEEEANLRKLHATNKINEKFNFYLRDVLTTAKDIFTKISLSGITKLVHMESSEYQFHAIRILYAKILNVIYTLVYTINLSSDLDETCDVVKLINQTTDDLLSRVNVIGEMIPTKRYFTKKVLKTLISDAKKQELHNHYGYVSPFADQVTLEDPMLSADEMTMRFTENMINLRSILEHTDITTETDAKLLFGIYSMVYNMVVQLFFNSAYLSKNKAPLVQSVNELFKRLNPNYNSIVSGDSLKNFINLTE
jgi:hypothetical protein